MVARGDRQGDRRHRLVARRRAPVFYTSARGTIRHEQTPDYSGAKIIYTITENAPGADATSCRRRGGTPIAAAARGGGFGGRRWLDARALRRRSHVSRLQAAHDRRRRHRRRRAARRCTRTSSEKFWSITGDAGAGAQPSPDGKWIAFLSDRDGWDHLYVDAGRRRRRRCRSRKGSSRRGGRRGRPTARGSRSTPTSRTSPAIASSASRRSAAIPRTRRSTTVTSGRGTNIAPQWSPDGTRLVYQHTDPQNSADLYVVDATSRRDSRCG